MVRSTSLVLYCLPPLFPISQGLNKPLHSLKAEIPLSPSYPFTQGTDFFHHSGNGPSVARVHYLGIPRAQTLRERSLF